MYRHRPERSSGEKLWGCSSARSAGDAVTNNFFGTGAEQVAGYVPPANE